MTIGAIPTSYLESMTYAELTKVGWSINYGMFGMTMLGLDLISDGIVGTPGAWGNTYSGEGNYLKLELYSADGSVAPGTYVPAKGENPGPGEFKPGSAAGGTQWTVFAGGSSTTEFVTEGEITVSVDGSVCAPEIANNPNIRWTLESTDTNWDGDGKKEDLDWGSLLAAIKSLSGDASGTKDYAPGEELPKLVS